MLPLFEAIYSDIRRVITVRKRALRQVHRTNLRCITIFLRSSQSNTMGALFKSYGKTRTFFDVATAATQ